MSTISRLHPSSYPRSEGERFNADATLHAVTCASCGVLFAIPESFHKAARKYNATSHPGNYWSICCPFGHQWHYTGRDETQELRDQLRATRDLLAVEESAHAATRGHVVRQAKRAAAGVCPCCNRTFQQLARHMKAKHPSYGKNGNGDAERPLPGARFYILGATVLHRAYGWRLKSGDVARSWCGHANGPVYTAASIESALPKCKVCFPGAEA